MNVNEQQAHDAMVKKGWTVLRNGWPDFLVLKTQKVHLGGTWEKRVLSACAVEFKAKSTGDKLRGNQEAMHEALRSLGIPVHIMTNGSTAAVKAVERRFFYPRPLDLLKHEAVSLKEHLGILLKRIEDHEEELEAASLLFEPESHEQLFGNGVEL